MIANTLELHVTLKHLTSLTDMLTALYLDAKEQNDFKLFPAIGEGYFVKIHELNAEIGEYLEAHPQAVEPTLSEPATA